jgi:hypothetical protein
MTMTLPEAKTFADWVAGRLILGLAILFVLSLIPLGKDDTDPENGRSGMRPRTDARTGCQYLETSQGGITPRLDSSGRHICTRS